MIHVYSDDDRAILPASGSPGLSREHLIATGVVVPHPSRKPWQDPRDPRCIGAYKGPCLSLEGRVDIVREGSYPDGTPYLRAFYSGPSGRWEASHAGELVDPETHRSELLERRLRKAGAA